nr:AAA family ATPase [Georgenia satyanarayanai]
MLRHDDPLPRHPQRVLVAGVSGAGKTTLARRVAAVTGAPHTEIDALFHGPGWEPRADFLADVRALAARDAWTTEWQYADARPILAQRADLLVWLDLPFGTVTLPRLVRRTLRRRLRREEPWNGNVEPPLWTVLTDREHALGRATRDKLRSRVPRLEEQAPHLVVVRLRSPREVDQWVGGPLRAACRGEP